MLKPLIRIQFKFVTTLEKFGATAMLIGFVVFVSASPSKSFAYYGPPPESDSVILARQVRQVKINHSFQEFSDHSFNAHYTDQQTDSIFTAGGNKIVSARIIYSPDSAFKIVSIGCETCADLCKTEWNSWIHYLYALPLVTPAQRFHEIMNVTVLPDGKYLILDQEKTVSANGSVLTQRAWLYSLDRFEHAGSYLSFPGTPSLNRMTDTTDGLTLRNTYFNQKYPSYLQYDAGTNRLNYQYSAEVIEKVDYDYAYIYTGYFLYENGVFIHKEEDRLILAD